MIGQDQERDFLEEAKALLDETARNLDNRTRKGLAQIRINALASVGEKLPGFFSFWRWITVGGLATATVAGVALFFFLKTSPANLPAGPIQDLEIITSREPIDFYENLEFYRWMAAQDRQSVISLHPKNSIS
jgi:hypothetical protein